MHDIKRTVMDILCKAQCQGYLPQNMESGFSINPPPPHTHTMSRSFLRKHVFWALYHEIQWQGCPLETSNLGIFITNIVSRMSSTKHGIGALYNKTQIQSCPPHNMESGLYITSHNIEVVLHQNIESGLYITTHKFKVVLRII